MVSQTDRACSLPFPRESPGWRRPGLQTNPYPMVQRVSCECNDRGHLFLRGYLPSYYQKQLAQEAVAGLPGVTQVVNQTEVPV